jgi:hypothetical protein
LVCALAVLLPPCAAARSLSEAAIPVTRINGEMIRNLPATVDVLHLAPGVGLSESRVGRPAEAAGRPRTGDKAGQAIGRGNMQRIEVRTNADGVIPVRTVPNGQWNPAGAFDGGVLTLPENTFGAVYGRDTIGGVVNVLPRKPFGIRDGNLLSGRDWMRDVTAPFSLLCRSDEGVPDVLSTGPRYAYRVPGDEKSLKWLYSQPYVIDPECYVLPDRQGFDCSSAAGANPPQVQDSLAQAQMRGAIKDVEIDGCDLFFPDADTNGRVMGCVQGEKRFPEKAVHVSGELGGTLRGPFNDMPVGDGWVQYGPLSPTPFYDPGELPGDEQGPKLARTGADGAYRASLDALAGPLEITAAKDCAQHTTVVIADGAKPAPPPPASQPRPKPLESANICGPDVTGYVLDILAYMRRVWWSWDEATQQKRCSQIVSIRTALGAWDMAPFSPTSYQSLQVAPEYCGVPEWPCGATVEFMGYCVPAQVVNYVQWGAMTRLCDNEGEGMLWHLARDTLGAGWSDVKNLVTLNWGQLDNPVEGNAYEGQWAMARVGSAFMGVGDTRDFAAGVMKGLLDKYVAEAGDTWTQMDGASCALICTESAGADLLKERLDNLGWGFQWGSAYGGGDASFTLRQERVEQELKRMQEQRKAGGAAGKP